MTAAEALAAGSRWRLWEGALLAALVASWFVLPGQALIANEIAILALFALSLDLILGYAGIVSLGHAAFFGFAAYVAALFAKHVMPDPLVGLAVAVLAAAALGLATSVLVLRGSDLTRLMITLGIAALLYELANKLEFTGGADGLQGVVMGPLVTPFGRFEFDLYGRVAFGYSLSVLVLALLVARRVVHSPFGWSLQAIRDNRLRASAIGFSVNARLAAVYTLAAAFAGASGALLAQTSGFASLDVLDFHRSADVLLVLVIGGTGYLWGGVIGAIVFKLLHDLIAAWTPQYWSFWLGLFLVVLVLVGRERLFRPGVAAHMTVVLETRALNKRFGGLVATKDVSLTLARGARHALIGPNGAGKTTLINQLTGVLAPSSGSVWLDGADVTRVPAHRRVKRGLVRTFQINQLFGALTPLQALSLAVSQRLGHGASGRRPLGRDARVAERCERLLAEFHLADVMAVPTRALAYGKQRLLELALAIACEPRVLLLDEPAAGVPEGERHEIFASLKALPASVSVLLIEHDMDLVFNFAERVTVLVDGAVFAEGDVAEVAADSRVKAVYLGERHG